MRLSSWYSNLKYKYKIMFISVSLILALSISFLAIFIISAETEYRNESRIIANERASVVIETFDHEWKFISMLTIKELASEVFNTSMNALISGDSSYEALDNIQTILKKIKDSSSLVQCAYILDSSGRMYNHYEDYVTKKGSLTDFDTMKKISGLDILEVAESPFLQNTSVLPVVIPLCHFNSRSLQIANGNEAELILVILLDEGLIRSIISIKDSSFFESTSSLEYNGKQVLSPEYEVEKDKFFIERDTLIDGLSICFFIKENKFPQVRALLLAILIAGILVVLLIAVLLIRKTSERLTSPLDDMTKAVDKIAKRTYDYSLNAKYNDETGTLIKGFNEMYATIEEQIQRIKNEEEIKYLYKSQMLTLEIHPHFIYNTLEMIDMEVISGNNDAASDMLQTFATFLRYTLNQRKDGSTLKQECLYIESYMELMNKRRSDSIGLITELEAGLEDFIVPKSILLPLVENSIKHGFPPEKMYSIHMPEIRIRAFRKGDFVHIIVIDNGLGIDTDKAESIIHDTEAQKGHIGIGNVYGRIKLYYKSAEMYFRSIPFFQNEVELVLEGEMLSTASNIIS